MEAQGLARFYDEKPIPRKSFIRQRIKTLIYLPDDGPKYMVAMVPLRLLIFVMTLTLLTLLVYLSTLNTPELRDASALLMIGVTTAFLFFSVIHIIGHFGSTHTVEYPMIFGSFIAIVCFTFIGAVIAYSAPTRSWARLLSFVFCFIIAFLHTADVLLALGYWRHKYSTRRNHAPTMQMRSIPDSHTYTQTVQSALDVCKCDVQTSMTGTGIAVDPYDDYPFRTHRTKRNEVVPHNSYVECPARAGFSMMAARGMQTDYSPIQREVQTTRIEVKEIPVQTASKCDLCHRHIDTEPITHRQICAPLYEISPPRYPTIATSPYRSMPIQTVPTHSTPSSSPTRKNLMCLCKHQINYVPQLSPPLGPTGTHCCGSCNCSLLTSGRKAAVTQHQPHQTLNATTLPRHVDPTSEINPHFDMNLNLDSGDKKHARESHRVYEARSSSSRTKPFIGRLAAMSGCLTTSSSSSLRIHKNKRTQTRGQSSKKHDNPEKENEVVRNVKSKNRKPIKEEKFIAKEVEVRSIDLNSPHRAMIKNDPTTEKEINLKSHGRNIIEVKEKKKKDKEKLLPKSNNTNKEINNRAFSTNVLDPGRDSTPSKTRTKTLYRETPINNAKVEKGATDRISAKLNDDRGGTSRKTMDEIPPLHVEKESRTNIKASPPIDKVALNRQNEIVTSKNKTSDPKEELKNSGRDEEAGGSGWRSRSRTNSGSFLFRTGESSKTTYEANPPENNETPRSRKENTIDKPKPGSEIVKKENFTIGTDEKRFKS